MELTIETLIKLILGVIVIVLVVTGLFFFSSKTNDFFKNLPGGNNSKESSDVENVNDGTSEEESPEVTADCQIECDGGGWIDFEICTQSKCESLGCKYEDVPWSLDDKCVNK